MRRSVLPLLYAAVVAVWVLAFLYAAFGQITTFDGHLFNGAFQHYNAIRRIDAGQTGGVDFQFYHGLGVPYLHYPLFRLFGGDLFASEAARYLVNLLAYLLPYPLVFYAATRNRNAALGLTAAALVLSEPLGLYYLAWPSHNTPGLRAMVPYLMLALLLAGVRRRRETVLGGVLAGCGFLLGTEHGIAAGVMLAIVYFCPVRGGGRLGGRGIYFATATLVGLATAGGLLVAIGGVRGAWNALRYALQDVPADQFWYFGTPTLPYLGSWAEVFADHRMLLAYGAAATQAGVLLAWAARSPAGRAIGVPLIGGLVYGVAASVGYLSYTGYQFHLPLIRVELTVALVLLWRAVGKLRALEPAKFGPAVRALQYGFAATALVAGPLNAFGPSSVARLPEMARAAAGGSRTIARGDCRLSDRLTEHLDQLVRSVEENRGRVGPPSIWSEYAGLLEAYFGVFHPSHDYIIHARGPGGSAAYLAAFRAADAEFAFTFHQGYFPHVQKHQSVDWGFYEELFGNYEPVVRTWVGILWKRRPGPWKPAPDSNWTSIPLELPDAFTLPAQSLRDGHLPAVVVEVEYEICRTPGTYLPVLGGSPRYLLYQFQCHTEVPVPARPYADRMTFPVVLNPGRAAHFYAATRSLVGGRWVLKAVRVRPLTGETAKHYLETLRL